MIDILKSIVSKKLKNSIHLTSLLREDLSLSSIQMVTLASELEERANFDILARDDIDFTEIKTVQHVIALLE